MMLRLTGKRPILFRLHKNVWASLGRLEKFIFNEWRYHNHNTRDLARALTPTDAELYYIDISDINWVDYFVTLHLGVRRYLNKEKESTLPAARKKDIILLAAHVVWQMGIIYVLWLAVAALTGLSMTHSAWAPPLIYMLLSLL